MKTIKLSKIDEYYICSGFPKGERNCGQIFYNSDDNVCTHCGSKNTRKIESIRVY